MRIVKSQNNRQPKSAIIRQKCLQQNEKFKQWAKRKSWSTFHSSHYDWWAFPIDTPSGSHGSAYQVEQKQLQVLIKDEKFTAAVEQNAVLVCRSWGWNLKEGNYIKDPQSNQKWQRWPIRLSKMCRSLQIFNNKQLFQNSIKYGIQLLKEYKKFTYGGKDLTPYFYKKYQQIQTKRGQKQKNEQKIQLKQELKFINQKIKEQQLNFQYNNKQQKIFKNKTDELHFIQKNGVQQ